MKYRTAQGGFTLLEVLIALTLMAVLSMLSWRALDSTARSSEHLEAYASDTMALLRALGQVESDLTQHVGTDVLPPAAADDDKPREASVLPPGVRWQASQLSIVRETQEGGWQEVVWQLDAGRLMRAAGLSAVTLPLPEASQAETMLTGVSAFTVRAWVPGQGWSATTAANPQRARGMEITLSMSGSGESFRKVVVLP
ncbi:MAG TPA: prepilin-type N-terminal cleavage/methylation domain-containing protein [Burkholderiaceae bacterium]|nr:prepilin-type N-terminal cleavage/methylation domain-containing protein [Burkholderiaceae bacterium]